ncbi:MAG TPA: hypothetical protein VGE86_02345 [Thermoanaerobaculia bacterium]
MEGYTPPPGPVPPPGDPTGEPVRSSGSYQRPAEYYETPGAPAGSKRGCPRWLLFGCGGLGCLGLIVIFGLGFWATRGGGARISGFVISSLEKDAEELYTDDVPQEDREALRQELNSLKDHIRAEQVDLMELQPVLSEINGAIRDRTLTQPEVEALIDTIRDINEKAGEKPVSV